MRFVVALLLLAVAVVPTAGSADRVTSSGAAVAYTLEWPSKKGGDPHLGVAVAGFLGNGRHEVTPRKAKWDDYNAVWSPDGTRFVFIRAIGGRGFLYVASRDGSGVRRVAQLGPIYVDVYASLFDVPAWSPDGSRIAYGNGALYVANADGMGSRRLVASSTCNPVWSPDGKSLAYLVDREPCADRGSMRPAPGHRAIYRIDANGSHRRLLARGSFGGVAWSPDGSLIAHTAGCQVSHGQDWSCLAFLMNPDGSAKRQLAKGVHSSSTVQWTAGGKELLQDSFQSGPFATNLATGTVRTFVPASSTGAWGGVLSGLSTDGQAIAVLSYGPKRRIFMATGPGQVARPATTPKGWKVARANVHLP